jgi:hypothetical protein
VAPFHQCGGFQPALVVKVWQSRIGPSAFAAAQLNVVTSTGLINSSSNSNEVTIPTFVPFAEAVHFVFDGHGKFSGSSTADYGGTIFPVTFTGTYSVKPNCTGSLTADAGSNVIIHRDLVIVDSGKEVEFVSTDAGLVISGYVRKQHAE